MPSAAGTIEIFLVSPANRYRGGRAGREEVGAGANVEPSRGKRGRVDYSTDFLIEFLARGINVSERKTGSIKING